MTGRELCGIMSERGYTLALSDGKEIVSSSERGIFPLLGILGGGRGFAGWMAADKVVGRAAASVYVQLGVKEVYARVMSAAAQIMLRGYGISAGCDTLADEIINREGTGVCPMEEAVAGLADPDDCIAALRRRAEEMKRISG